MDTYIKKKLILHCLNLHNGKQFGGRNFLEILYEDYINKLQAYQTV